MSGYEWRVSDARVYCPINAGMINCAIYLKSCYLLDGSYFF
ncbi:hypothetical protein PSAB6_460044 [Paraburkholderia sabiae]|nr:hypothetical protein PSAB6_460044 [Paraburkholderia sabiae]